MRGSNISFTEKIETLVDAFLYEYIDYNLEIENLILTIEGDTIKSVFDIFSLHLAQFVKPSYIHPWRKAALY